MGVTREQIIAALKAALEPLDYVHALVEAGSAAFERLDELSDIDLVVDAGDGREAEVLSLVGQVLVGLAPIDQRWEVPQPAWHGMHQCFYHLASTSAYLLIDFCVRPLSKAGHFGEREQHGVPLVYFDKRGTAQPTALDQAKLARDIAARLAFHRDTFAMFAPLVLKEVLRGRPLDALACYHSQVLRPLVELLRIRYDPARFSFGMRYLHFDLPPEVAARLQDLAYVADLADLKRKYELAYAWVREELRRHFDSVGQASCLPLSSSGEPGGSTV